MNEVRAEQGGISDWRVVTQKGTKHLTVFLDREIGSAFGFQVAYERLFSSQPNSDAAFEIPLIALPKANRQRGMITLLSGHELALKPQKETGVSKVGENQLPPAVRKVLERPVTHTYRYSDPQAKLRVQVVPPEKKQANFEASVDTLFSLSDVAMKAAASVRVHIKSGATDHLRLALPLEATLLSLTAPSKRDHQVETVDGRQEIAVHFTQELEGEFSLEVEYEVLTASEKDAELTAPMLSVLDAEPEQGRIAIEALTAAKISALEETRLSTVDIAQLPEQLVLKTRNPIRLAYKYVQADPPPHLRLKISRHAELDTQIASIETARFQTLYTLHGLAVTTATFTVKNSRKQFLKICLPEKSEVWSVFVDGKPEKPALATAEAKAEAECSGLGVLIKIINSADGFPVELVYRTQVSELSGIGQVSGTLPRPDMVATHTRWDVFVPDKLSYADPDTNMDLVEAAVFADRTAMNALARKKDEGFPQTSSFRVAVPVSGLRYSFEKLYANQTEEAPYFSITYVSAAGKGASTFLVIIGTLLVFGALCLGVLKHPKFNRQIALALGLGGASLLWVAIHFFNVGVTSVLTWILVEAVVLAIVLVVRRQPRLRVWRSAETP